MPDDSSDRSPRPDPHATFRLAPGVRLEPLEDGSAVLYSRDLDQSLSLNHTAALLCSFADGRHTLSMVVQEMSQVFPEDAVDAGALLACLSDLEARRFLRWS